MTDDYSDIISLPHHVSQKHPPMPRADRAAQFAPFAALSGLDDAVAEEARQTSRQLILDEDEKARLNAVLLRLRARLAEGPQAAVTYFQPDARKSGGSYVTVCGVVRGVDPHARIVTLSGGERIPIDDIVSLRETDGQALDG